MGDIIDKRLLIREILKDYYEGDTSCITEYDEGFVDAVAHSVSFIGRDYKIVRKYMKYELTRKQKEIYLILKKFIDENGYSPTVREMMKLSGTTSTANITRYYNVLEHRGWIKSLPHTKRAITLVEGSGDFNTGYAAGWDNCLKEIVKDIDMVTGGNQ